MIVFSNSQNRDNAGSVSAIPLAGYRPGSLLQVEGWGQFALFKSIFTSVQLQAQTNHFFSHTLSDRLYLYVFGDRESPMTLSGLSFVDNCQQGSRMRPHGIGYVADFFKRAKLSSYANPLRITLDPSLVVLAYLHGFTAQAVHGSDTHQHMYQFNLQLTMLPHTVFQAEARAAQNNQGGGGQTQQPQLPQIPQQPVQPGGAQDIQLLGA